MHNISAAADAANILLATMGGHDLGSRAYGMTETPGAPAWVGMARNAGTLTDWSEEDARLMYRLLSCLRFQVIGERYYAPVSDLPLPRAFTVVESAGLGVRYQLWTRGMGSLNGHRFITGDTDLFTEVIKDAWALRKEFLARLQAKDDNALRDKDTAEWLVGFSRDFMPVRRGK